MTNALFSTTSLAATTLVLFSLGACTANVGYPGTGSGTDTSTAFTSETSSFMTVSDLVSLLRTQGNTADLNGQRVQQPFFAASGQEIHVNNDTVQVYQYPDANSAKADADKISDNGMSVGGTSMSWAGPPHFFQKDNLLVLYVGTNAQTIGTLESTLGVQFAGSSESSGGTTGTGTTMGTSSSRMNVNSSY